MKNPRSISVYAALTIGVMAISCAAIFFRQASQTDPWVAAGWRLVLASVLLSVFLARAFKADELTRDLVKSAAIAGAFYALHFGSWVTSLQYTTIAASVTLVTATPVMLALWSWWSGRDRPNSAVVAAIFVSSIGIVMIGGGDLRFSATALFGDGLALLGALAMALYMLKVRQLGVFPLFAFSCIATAVGGGLLLLGAGVRGVPLVPDSPRSVMFIALAALIPQLIGHNAMTWALRFTTPTVVGLATLVEPVGAAFLAWWVFSEVPSSPVAIGCVFTLAGVAIAVLTSQFRPLRRPKEAQQATLHEPE